MKLLLASKRAKAKSSKIDTIDRSNKKGIFELKHEKYNVRKLYANLDQVLVLLYVLLILFELVERNI